VHSIKLVEGATRNTVCHQLDEVRPRRVHRVACASASNASASGDASAEATLSHMSVATPSSPITSHQPKSRLRKRLERVGARRRERGTHAVAHDRHEALGSVYAFVNASMPAKKSAVRSSAGT